MNYFTEYNNMLAQVEIDKQNYKNCLKDITYDIFERFIVECLSLSIREALRNKQKVLKIYFDFINERMYEYSSGTEAEFVVHLNGTVYNYGTVNKFQFLSYLNCMPQKINREDRTFMEFNLLDAINYYYEELQRIEYQIGKSR